MKKVLSGMILAGAGCWLLAAGAQATQTSKSGTISANQTWSDTINITGTVTISGGTVTVSPGTIVRFATTSTTYEIAINGNGGMIARGTALSPILFTTASASPKKSMWSRIAFQSLLQDTVTTDFKYCNFEYGRTAADFRNVSGAEISKVNFDHCNFRHLAGAGVYLTSGGASTITHCTFFDCSGSAVFSHPASTLTVKYCTFDSCTSSINLASGLDPFQADVIDHVTIYRTDLRMQTSYQTWNGDGIATINSSPGGNVNITNSIIQYSTKYGFEITKASWTIAQDYNCWFDSWILTLSDNSFSLGAHSLPDDTDPLLADPARHDFRLKTGSPCIGQASDGTNMGCSQEVVTTGINATPPNAGPQVTVTALPNPFAQQTTITVMCPDKNVVPAAVTIYNMEGQEIRQFKSAAEETIWDGTNNSGTRIAAGLYIYLVRCGAQCRQGTLLVTAQ